MAVLCGALASNQVPWNGRGALILVLVLLLTNLAWGGLWNLASGTDWFRPLAEGWPPVQSGLPITLPYTRPDSPGGRLFRWLGRLVSWWQKAFWPVAGSALLASLTAGVLAGALVVVLPRRLYPLNAVLVALIGLGIVQRWRNRTLLAGQALVQIGLGWLAGHAAFAEVSVASLAVALGFVLASLGALRVGEGQAGGMWLLNGGQVLVAVMLALHKQPLAAGVIGLLLFGQVANQLPLHFGSEPAAVLRRVWPWLMVAMPVAALAIP